METFYFEGQDYDSEKFELVCVGSKNLYPEEDSCDAVWVDKFAVREKTGEKLEEKYDKDFPVEMDILEQLHKE